MSWLVVFFGAFVMQIPYQAAKFKKIESITDMFDIKHD